MWKLYDFFRHGNNFWHLQAELALLLCYIYFQQDINDPVMLFSLLFDDFRQPE